MMGLSDFGVLAQIWALVPNVKEKSNRIFMQKKKNYALVRIALTVVELE